MKIHRDLTNRRVRVRVLKRPALFFLLSHFLLCCFCLVACLASLPFFLVFLISSLLSTFFTFTSWGENVIGEKKGQPPIALPRCVGGLPWDASGAPRMYLHVCVPYFALLSLSLFLFIKVGEEDEKKTRT